MILTQSDIQTKSKSMTADQFIIYVTDCYLQHIGGSLTAETMDMLNTDQHTLMAYRWMMEEVMEGGFIQLITNGYAGYVLEGPFAFVLKKMWGMKDLAQLVFDVKREYHLHKDELERDMTDDEFMALYEQLETLNEMGDSFLDDYQEQTTPAVRDYVVQNAEKFAIL